MSPELIIVAVPVRIIIVVIMITVTRIIIVIWIIIISTGPDVADAAAKFEKEAQDENYT